MLGFSPLDALPLDTVEDVLYVEVAALLVAVTLGAGQIQPGAISASALAVAVVMPAATIQEGQPPVSPLLVAVELPAAIIAPPLQLTPLLVAIEPGAGATIQPALVVAPLLVAIAPGAAGIIQAIPTEGPLLVAVQLPALTITLPPIPSAGRPFTLLAQIDFTDPSAQSVYLSDQSVPAILGHDWLPYIAAWGPLEEITSAGAPATSELVLFNTKPIGGKARLSDWLRTPLNTSGTYEFSGAKVTLYRLDYGATTPKLLNKLFIEEPTEIDDRLFRLRMSDAGLLLENRLVATVIDRTVLPLSTRAVAGRAIPRAFGVLRGVPAWPVVDGASARLSGALTAAATSIPLVDAADMVAPGTVQIETEQANFTGKTGNTLTGVSRGANGTAAAAHADQARVLQVRSGAFAYRFVVSEALSAAYLHKSLSNVRVNGRAPKTAPTISANATDLISGKTMAVITFPVTDVVAFHTIPLAKTLPQPASLPTQDWIVSGHVNGVNRTLTVTVPTGSAEYALAGPVRRRCSMTWKNISGGFQVDVAGCWIARRDPTTGASIRMYNGTTDTSNNLQFPATMTFEYETGAGTGSETWEVNLNGDGSNYRNQWTITDYAISAQMEAGDGPGAGDSTASACIGTVTCDIEGIQDDASGTISGTPSLLLENPADITRAVLTLLYGVAVADLGARWAASRATLAGLAYKWAFLLSHEGAERLSDLRAAFAQQARAELFIEAGQWDYVVIPSAPAATLTLDYRRDVWAEAAAQASRSPRTQLFTSVRAAAQLDYVSGDYGYTALAQTAGVAQRTEENLSLSLVQDRATADALAAFYLGQWQRQRWQVDLVAWQNVLALRKADHIAITGHPVLEAHGGAALILRITERAYRSGDDNPARIRLLAREGNP
jgi:hypothetical protein